MSSDFPISDLYLFPLQLDEGQLALLRRDDHLLRRFGQAEVRRFKAGVQSPFKLRAVADEVWTPLHGVAQFTLIDLRPASPSENQSLEITLDAEQPQALLVPFGVACSIATQDGAELLRLTTHADGDHAEDRVISREDLQGFLPGS
jgi:dTDP-4-dehydrorhamnose 3,5-epimerase-like enzyme